MLYCEKLEEEDVRNGRETGEGNLARKMLEVMGVEVEYSDFLETIKEIGRNFCVRGSNNSSF